MVGPTGSTDTLAANRPTRKLRLNQHTYEIGP